MYDPRFDARYEAYPRIFRMRFFPTLLVLAFMLAGVLVVGAGRYAPPAAMEGLVPGLSSQTLQNLGALGFALGCAVLYSWYAPTRFQRFTITDDALSFTQGFTTKQRIRIPLDQVQSVRIDQTPWQRLLSIGDVSVYAGDGKQPVLVVRGLPDPEMILDLVPGRVPTAAAA